MMSRQKMKITTLCVGLATTLVLLSGTMTGELRAGGATAPADSSDPVAASRKAAGALGEALREKLMAAMKTEGPIGALGVCNTAAPGIAQSKSAELGLKIGRTSLKLRNPSNAPDAWERSVLEGFEKKLAAGADPATLEHHETVETNGKKTLRFMKAIPTGEPCLTCHGKAIAPDVAAEIKRLYPQDAATGFELKTLRGAFTVSRALN